MMKHGNDRMNRQMSRTGNTRPAERKPGGAAAAIGRVIILLALLGVFWWVAVRPALARVTGLPAFTISHVVVEGARHLDRSRIIEVSGIVQGGNVFRADLQGASHALSRHFAAEDFTLYRRLPDTIIIRVRERKPVALLNTQHLTGIDANGVLLPHIGADMAETLPIITGVEDVSQLADPGVRSRVVEGLKLLGAISDQSPSVHKRISEVNVSSVSGLGISLIDTGIEVIIGDRDWNVKLPNLERVVNQVVGGMDSVRTVDMRFGEKIFVRKSALARPKKTDMEAAQTDSGGNNGVVAPAEQNKETLAKKTKDTAAAR
jgi:cell division protein FtsQ